MKGILATLLFLCAYSSTAQNLKVSGGVSLSKGNIDADVLNEVIQQKQEELFSRLFQNIVITYFADESVTDGVYNFPTYYSIYNVVTDLTVGKSKTTVSKSVFNSISEMAYIYAFVEYFQDYQVANPAKGTTAGVGTKIGDAKMITKITNGKIKFDKDNLIRLNLYLEAAFEVLSKDHSVQNTFTFTRPVTSNNIAIWYNKLGLMNNAEYAPVAPGVFSFPDVNNVNTNLPTLVAGMQAQIPGFLQYTGTNKNIKSISALKKTALGIEDIKKADVDAIKLTLLDYANESEYLFDQNVVKNLFGLLVENIHFDADASQRLTDVYIDVESLILSLSKEFVNKQKRSSISSALFFIDPRPFFTIGTTTAQFLNDNKLDNVNGAPASLKNINFAAEKIGFKVKLWDAGYTHSFDPGEVYKWHGRNYVWDQPQKKPLIANVYYNVYTSGLLYNLVDLKTNKNFNYGFMGSNVGMQFFNGLELSSGLGWIYKDGVSAENMFLKLDFDIPIIDYLSALSRKSKK